MKSYLILLGLAICISCDSTDHLTIYNSLKGESVEIIVGADDNYQTGFLPFKTLNGDLLYQTFVEPGEIVKVGTVNRNYVPEPDDLNLDYVELRYGGDTIILKGKKAIHNSFYNEEGKFWRYKIK